jgi:proteasome lid subunit RPN8/RPN11
MVAKMIYMSRDAVSGMLAYFKSLHPREGILLMRGRVKKDAIHVEQLILPPKPTLAEDFSSFSLYDLPLDLSILGIAHSHPNGVQQPSLEDLNNFYGRFMVIATYPYRSEADIGVFDREGNRVVFKVI